jgi:AcrR family transcriptional regulator
LFSINWWNNIPSSVGNIQESDSPMRQKAVRANGLATQDKIMQAATAMFATSGYEATSLRQIAASAGVDIATLKYHFQDKPNLFGEVYKGGHTEFMAVIEPILAELDTVQTKEDMAVLIDEFVTRMHDFIEDNLPFVRLTVYRMLEDSADIISVEEELQAIAISRLDQKFQGLVERGVVRAIDTRALVVFLVASFSTWHVTGRVKANWLSKPGLDSEAGRARSESFFVDLLENYLI